MTMTAMMERISKNSVIWTASFALNLEAIDTYQNDQVKYPLNMNIMQHVKN